MMNNFLYNNYINYEKPNNSLIDIWIFAFFLFIISLFVLDYYFVVSGFKQKSVLKTLIGIGLMWLWFGVVLLWVLKMYEPKQSDLIKKNK